MFLLTVPCPTLNKILSYLILSLCDDISTLAKHLFVASWQYQQCKEVRDNLPEGAVLMQADFAENYLTLYLKCYLNIAENVTFLMKTAYVVNSSLIVKFIYCFAFLARPA